MHNTVWKDKEYSMVFNLGVPKGLLQVLKERGSDTRRMKLEDLRREPCEEFKGAHEIFLSMPQYISLDSIYYADQCGIIGF